MEYTKQEWEEEYHNCTRDEARKHSLKIQMIPKNPDNWYFPNWMPRDAGKTYYGYEEHGTIRMCHEGRKPDGYHCALDKNEIVAIPNINRIILIYGK